MIYQDAANDGFWYGYDDGAKLAHESDQEDDETARLNHSQGANLQGNNQVDRLYHLKKWISSYPGHGYDSNVLRVAGGPAARPPEGSQHAPEALRPDAPVDGVARGLRRPGHSRACVVVADRLHGRGHHAGHQSEDSGQRDDRRSPLDWN